MPAIGPLPRFAEVHVSKALQLIAEKGPLGRKELADELGIGEGSMRTILNRLERQGLITSSRAGHSITPKGKRALRKKPFECVQIDAGELTVGDVDVAVLVRGAAHKVKRGIEQRDEAIKAGASGATVLIFRRGVFQFPDRFLKVENKISNMLIKTLKPREEDVVVIGTGDDALSAEAGARAAARTLTTRARRS